MKSADLSYHSGQQDLAIIHLFHMNAIKFKIYKQVFKDICDKYDRARDFINERIEELCSTQVLSIEEVIFFSVYALLLSLLFLALN